ncbi:MAG: putative porin [Cyclobacteriaceae bacterium]
MKRISLIVISLVLIWKSSAQITDDSTQLVYNAGTTSIVLQGDIKNNVEIERHPDTTLYNLEKYSELDRRGRKFQDLGNNGTAMFPLFYPVTSQIGRTSGLSVYDPYMVDQSQLEYYDTKSPFMDLTVVFAGNGRSVVDFKFSRNINENWNFGFDIYRITSDKQIGKSGQQDRNVVGTVFDVYTYYKHPEKPYSAMLNVVNMGWDVEETGGVYVADLPSATNDELFEYEDSEIQLNDAVSNDKRLNVHLYHQYAWQKQLQFYHEFDFISQNNSYKDFGTATDPESSIYNSYGDFYNQFLIAPDSTYERFNWNEVRNEVGIKGDLANLFYRVYLKRRDIDFNNLYHDPTGRFGELFLGGYTRFDWRDKFNVEGQAEFLQSGEYLLNAQLNSDLIFGSYKSVRSKPAFITESYFGNHHEWYQNFNSMFTNEIKGGIQVDLKFLKIRPQGRVLTMDQFTYFDQTKTARQSSDIAVLTSLGGEFDLKLTTNKEFNEAFMFENEVYYTSVAGDGASNIRVPQLFYNGKLYWRGAWFKNTMGVQVGFNVHAKTRYFALGYAPEIQQFYLQDEFPIDEFYTVDAFLNMQINNLSAFVKMTNLNQQQDNGYFITPYYPGVRQTFDFGARWLFYD